MDKFEPGNVVRITKDTDVLKAGTTAKVVMVMEGDDTLYIELPSDDGDTWWVPQASAKLVKDSRLFPIKFKHTYMPGVK